MQDIRYWDVRHVSGESTHVDIDNGVTESAGTSFFDKAVVRVLGKNGWGLVLIDNYTRPAGRAFEESLQSAARLAAITGDTVHLAPADRRALAVPPVTEDPGTVSLEEKTSLLAAIERAAKRDLVVNTRATYTERAELVRFEEIIFSKTQGSVPSNLPLNPCPTLLIRISIFLKLSTAYLTSSSQVEQLLTSPANFKGENPIFSNSSVVF